MANFYVWNETDFQRIQTWSALCAGASAERAGVDVGPVAQPEQVGERQRGEAAQEVGDGREQVEGAEFPHAEVEGERQRRVAGQRRHAAHRQLRVAAACEQSFTVFNRETDSFIQAPGCRVGRLIS